VTGFRVSPYDTFPLYLFLFSLDAAGNQYDLARRISMKLCLCKKNRQKPFCDGAYRSVGFLSACEAYVLPSEVKNNL
jgi:CDGSH-type Zn-finger protein